MPFSNLGLHPSVLKNINQLGYEKPYPIQSEVIPAVLEGKDVLGIAKTGSGKTASYILPILTQLQSAKPLENRHIHTLILVPTRELAIQVNDVTLQFSKQLPNRVKSLAVFGGVSINPQMIEMQHVSLLIATPGRLIELVKNKALDLSSLKTLVLDEADKMLNLGFKEELEKILSFLPKKRQNLLFSATLSDDISHINSIVLKDPVIIEIESKGENIDQITQTGYFISDKKKGPLLRFLITKNDMKQVLVFTSSVFKADSVTEKLKINGILAMAIHSKKSQNARIDALVKFKNKKINVLVATDLIGRGIDIEELPYVINYELPRSPKDFIHRIGRTGRADASGEAISFVTLEDQTHFKVIQKKMGKWIDMIDGEALLDSKK